MRHEILRFFALHSAGAVLVALLIHSGFAQEPERKEPYPLVVLDISSLVEPVKDFPGPRFELSAGRALESLMREGAGFMDEGTQAHRPMVLTTVDLEELVRESDTVWESDPEFIRLNIINRRLFVQGPLDAVKRLRALLKVLEREASRSFHVRAVLVEVPKGKGRELLGKPGNILTGSEAERRMKALLSKGGKILADSSVCALSGQRVHIADGRERTFLVDYDVIIAKDVAEADPVVEVFRDGLILDVRPIGSPSGETVRLDLIVGYTRFDAETLRFDPENPKLGPLDLPRLTGFRMESSVALPTGGALLLGPLLPSPLLIGSPARPSGTMPGKKNRTEGETGAKESEPKGDVFLIVQVKAITK